MCRATKLTNFSHLILSSSSQTTKTHKRNETNSPWMKWNKMKHYKIVIKRGIHIRHIRRLFAVYAAYICRAAPRSLRSHEIARTLHFLVIFRWNTLFFVSLFWVRMRERERQKSETLWRQKENRNVHLLKNKKYEI